MQRTQLLLSTVSVSSSLSVIQSVGQRVSDIIDNILAFLGYKCFNFFLIDLHVIAPGTNNGKVRTLDSILAIIWTT